jgi:hypothetical protein
MLPAIRCVFVSAMLAFCAGTARAQAAPGTATIPAGVPLRVELDHRAPLKAGTRVEGHLIAPVFLVDHQVIPVNTRISGTILGTHPVSRNVRADAVLNGDFTPLAVPEVSFDHLILADGSSVPIRASATQRDAGVVRMRAAGSKRPSIRSQVTDQVKQRKQEALDTITKPGKGERLRRYLYMQLPYHPQDIWAGTQYDVDLSAPLSLPDKPPPSLPLADMGGRIPTGSIEARLTQALNSHNQKQGEAVEAVLTKPLFDEAHQNLVLPQGTRLTGTVLQAKPARWFARNGKLRFTFRQFELPEATQQQAIHGQMTAAEADSAQNLTIDSEGGAKASSGRNKFLAPLALGILAASSMDQDRDGNIAAKSTVVSNGFGIIARVVAVAAANPNVSAGFAYFALSKSVYKRWIAKGHEVDFPRDTRLQIDLSER